MIDPTPNETKTKEQREEEMIREYVTNRLKSLLSINEDIFRNVVAEITTPVVSTKDSSNENRNAFRQLYEEAQLFYLSELDEGHRMQNLENALKKAEEALKNMGVQNLITMEDENDVKV